jgi:hypothetical protein
MYQRASCQGCPRGGGIFADIALEASPVGYAARKTPGRLKNAWFGHFLAWISQLTLLLKKYYSGELTKNIS